MRRRSRSARSTTYLKRYRIRPTPQQAVGIRARLEALAELCERSASSADEGATEFGVTLAFYETVPPTPVKNR
jgi:hypothetical protein